LVFHCAKRETGSHYYAVFQDGSSSISAVDKLAYVRQMHYSRTYGQCLQQDQKGLTFLQQ
jgi:hypothetical protein